MKHSNFAVSKRLSAVAIGMAMSATTAQADMATYAIDPDHQTVAFTIMHAGYARTLGRFAEVQGTFDYNDETQELSNVRVTIETASVQTWHEARDNHVRSDDFLAADAHPQITFTADAGTPSSETTGTVRGDLTIRGVTKPVTLDVTKNQLSDYPCCHGKETVGISATTRILRSDFGSTYALPVFVGDEVDIMLEFEAIRQD
ncbi:YceI family protein [uncultured Roseobacter sp.]|uniref:YceI family protein n=1 Tax=uncultured Roseobacter sp. TaxID=114847 RepID=UPI00260F1D1D|nr:YceI family protein [uncultured Roseobacter sp.]